jgi:hypothetical protein
MVNFIKAHIIKGIYVMSSNIYKSTNHKGFLFLDSPIKDGKYLVNRINRTFLFQKDEILPISWYSVSAKTILKIHKKLLNNEVSLTKK